MLETLRALNPLYDREHGITPGDVEAVRRMIARIESTRSERQPRPGDRLVHISCHGDYAPDALVERPEDGGRLAINIIPFVPFVSAATEGVHCHAGGGPMTAIAAGELHYAGYRPGEFLIWGHDGPAGHGAIRFRALVAGWSYREPEALYGDYTTRDWRRLYVYCLPRPDGSYRYETDGYEIGDEAAFRRFLHDFEGRVFPGQTPRQRVVWCYRDIERGLTQEAWEAIDAPVTARRIYGVPQPVKLVKDHAHHRTSCFYVQPHIVIR